MKPAGSTTITIRDMRRTDRPSIVRWHRDLHVHVARTMPRHLNPHISPKMASWYGTENLRLTRRARGFILVAEVAGKAVGFLTGEVAADPHRLAQIEQKPNLQGKITSLFVEPGARNRGVGTALLGEAEARFRAMNCDNLQLGVVAGNADARRLYRKLGFEEFNLKLRKIVARPPRDWAEVRKRRTVALARPVATRRASETRESSGTA
jgi:ribosomal protein S18 acetylase RimI-like enzyme